MGKGWAVVGRTRLCACGATKTTMRIYLLGSRKGVQDGKSVMNYPCQMQYDAASAQKTSVVSNTCRDRHRLGWHSSSDDHHLPSIFNEARGHPRIAREMSPPYSGLKEPSHCPLSPASSSALISPPRLWVILKVSNKTTCYQGIDEDVSNESTQNSTDGEFQHHSPSPLCPSVPSRRHIRAKL